MGRKIFLLKWWPIVAEILLLLKYKFCTFISLTVKAFRIGNWQPTVPSWEKKFCWEVGRVPWKKLLETKKYIHTYENILKWDDSAVEDSFKNAKARYWAGLNGFPCEIPLPDPDAHIDEVDWNMNIDPELILDLDCDFVVADNKGERVLIFDEMFAKSQGLTNNGWGDADVANDGNYNGVEWSAGDPWESKVKENVNGWNFGNGDKSENEMNFGNNDGAENDDGAKNGWNFGNSDKVKNGWNFENSDRGWNCKNGDAVENGQKCDLEWKQWENKVNKYKGDNFNCREGTGRNMSRYNTTRFHGDKFGNYKDENNDNGYNGNCMSRYKVTRFYSDDQVNNQWERKNRNGRRRENFVHDQRWCRPINNHGSAEQANHWG